MQYFHCTSCHYMYIHMYLHRAQIEMPKADFALVCIHINVVVSYARTLPYRCCHKTARKQNCLRNNKTARLGKCSPLMWLFTYFGQVFFKLHDIGLLYSMLTYGFKLTLAILGLGNYFTNQSGHSDWRYCPVGLSRSKTIGSFFTVIADNFWLELDLVVS
jgi:hypothetical protein